MSIFSLPLQTKRYVGAHKLRDSLLQRPSRNLCAPTSPDFYLDFNELKVA